MTFKKTIIILLVLSLTGCITLARKEGSSSSSTSQEQEKAKMRKKEDPSTPNKANMRKK